MKLLLKSLAISLLSIIYLSSVQAGIVSSNQVIGQEYKVYQKQQILDMVATQEVQAKLISLGVDPQDAQKRIANMTQQELVSLNAQMEQMPAGGILGTIVTVLVVLAVTDALGLTDVYTFIRPIN